MLGTSDQRRLTNSHTGRARQGTGASQGSGRQFFEFFEGLECRTLLSAVGVIEHPHHHCFGSASPSAAYTNSSGYTPSQIRNAYGFNQVSFASASNGAISGDGRGQTIAIVDAYNDPHVKNDLGVFDSHFGLNAPPSFTVVNQGGGSGLPATDSGWASEIALDVEWAHAVAPQANLLLVEANSDNVTDLLAGVNYARHAAGVSVVSMSWGGSEFQGENAYDSTFTTPKGHPGVTFLNASGDDGSSSAEWPSTSPNVVSVGGTSLDLQNASGAYKSESAWTGSTGGASQYEPRPGYQSRLPSSDTTPPPQYGAYGYGGYRGYGGYGGSTLSGPARSTPDVSYNADPNTGFAVYDSVPYQGQSGWGVVGGTSAGAPQWAALIAIANQGRALHGAGSLDGASATLPVLYGIYSAPGTVNFSSYSSILHDVKGGASYDISATTGYDQATGLGTPRVPQVVSTLSAQPVSTTSPSPAATSTKSVKAATLRKSAGRHVFHAHHSLARPLAGDGQGNRTADVSLQNRQPDPATPDARTPEAPPTEGTGGPPGIPIGLAPRASSTALPGSPVGAGATEFSVPGSLAVPTGDLTVVVTAPAAAPPVASAGPTFYAGAVDGGVSRSGSASAAGGSTLVAIAAFPQVATGLSQTAAASSGLDLSAALGGLSNLSLWGRLSSLFAAGPSSAPSVELPRPALTGSVLGLAPALWTKQLSDSRTWEMTAAVCFGLTLAGYWYTTATTREAESKHDQTKRLRRVREGWDLTPYEPQ